MLMMRVGHMPVAVLEGRVFVPVWVRLAQGIAGSVRMLVMVVVTVGVLMRERRVEMAVLVLLGDVKPDAHAHQAGGGQQLDGRWLFGDLYRTSEVEESLVARSRHCLA